MTKCISLRFSVGGDLTRFEDIAGHFAQLDVEMLGGSAQYVERLLRRDALAFDEDAFGLTNDLPGPECRDEGIDSVEPDIERQGRILPSLGGTKGDTGVSREYQRLGPVDSAIGTGKGRIQVERAARSVGRQPALQQAPHPQSSSLRTEDWPALVLGRGPRHRQSAPLRLHRGKDLRVPRTGAGQSQTPGGQSRRREHAVRGPK